MEWVKENIANIPSMVPFLAHVEVIEHNVHDNPTLCVETCKSLIEAICKTILNNKNLAFSNSISFSSLVQQTITSILSTDETYQSEIIDLARRTAGVADRLGLIRDHAGFVSHGMDVLNPHLTDTLSLFACKITDALGGFILRCYNNNRIINADHRIHYDDCKPFNEEFDELNPSPYGLSTSLSLFQQDYEAYKASYFDYLNELSSDLEAAVAFDESENGGEQ